MNEHENKYLISKKLREEERQTIKNMERVKSLVSGKELGKFKSSKEEQIAEELKNALMKFMRKKEEKAQNYTK